MLVDSTTSKYHVGEKWKFNARPGEDDAALTVVKVESAWDRETIVHISVEGVRIKNEQAPEGYSPVISHMPFTEEAIDKSVTSLLAKESPLPDFEEGYREWRKAFDAGRAGAFTITVGEGVELMEKAINQ